MAAIMKLKGLILNEAELRDFERHVEANLHIFVSRGFIRKGEMRNGVRVWLPQSRDQRSAA